MGFANVYYGLADHAVQRAMESIKTKKSLALTRSMAYHPEVQHSVAEMLIELSGIGPHVEKAAQDWSDNTDPSRVGALLVGVMAAKHHAVHSAWSVVDRAFELAGGMGIFKSSGWERILRDARLGRIHPANSFLTHELIAKLSLGINPDEQPRWG
jgi:alkylation response protein AidB-like acyl-CoA dehydrogenase